MTTQIAIPSGARPPSAVQPTEARAAAKSEPEDKAPQAAATKATISAAALAMAKEAAETPAQTAQEAQHNDPQAQRLLAKQGAMHKAYS